MAEVAGVAGVTGMTGVARVAEVAGVAGVTGVTGVAGAARHTGNTTNVNGLQSAVCPADTWRTRDQAVATTVRILTAPKERHVAIGIAMIPEVENGREAGEADPAAGKAKTGAGPAVPKGRNCQKKDQTAKQETDSKAASKNARKAPNEDITSRKQVPDTGQRDSEDGSDVT